MIRVDIGQIPLRQENEKHKIFRRYYRSPHFLHVKMTDMKQNNGYGAHLNNIMLLIMENYHTILWS